MRIIISPAKKMNVDSDSMAWESLPHFLDEAGKIRKWMKTLTLQQAQKLWGCNEKLALMNYRRFQEMDLRQNLTPAILSYEGIQYQYMSPLTFTREAWAYVQKNLRILSGFYGVLRPLDGVVPYRLEMQARTLIEPEENSPGPEVFGQPDMSEGKNLYGAENLYEFWSGRLYREVLDDSRVIVNLASKEYSKCVEDYLSPGDRFVTCIFGELKNGKVIQKGTYAKMARGEMVRFLAENQVEQPEGMKAFDRLGYRFAEGLSGRDEYVFISH